MNIQTLRDGLAYVEAALHDIHERNADAVLSAEDRTAWDEGVAYVEATRAAIADFEARERVFQVSREHGQPGDDRSAQFHINRAPAPADIMSDRSATPQALADAVTRALEPRVERPENMAHVRSLLLRHRMDRDWSRALLVRSSDAYESAWAKVLTGRGWDLTPEERTVMSSVTDANGGLLVPTHLDPTVILSNSGSSNVIRGVSRVVTLTRPGDNSWQGITSDGVTASFDAQLTEVSDDSPTVVRPTIPVHKAQALVQASIELTEDVSGLAGEILRMFGDAKDRLEGAAHATGSGSDAPTGIFTALDANTNAEIISDTAAAINKEDLDEMYRSVPVRFRGNARWLMNPIWALAIQNLGTAVSNKFTTDLSNATTDFLYRKPVLESDDAPSSATTTVKDNEIIFGDFMNYVIVDKPGSFAVEYIPHLFNTTTNLPDGRRAWYAYWRTGADSVVDTAFRMLQDKTSA